MKAKANIIKDGQFYRQGDEIWELGSWVATEVYGNLQAVYTTVDTAARSRYLYMFIGMFLFEGIYYGRHAFGVDEYLVGYIEFLFFQVFVFRRRVARHCFEFFRACKSVVESHTTVFRRVGVYSYHGVAVGRGICRAKEVLRFGG